MVRVTRFELAASCSQTYREHFFRLFILVFSHFCSVPVTLWHSLKGLFPGVPELSVVIYVVKNASRPVSGEDSPMPDGKRLAFLCGVYCNSGEGIMQVVSAPTAAQILRRNKQGNKAIFLSAIVPETSTFLETKNRANLSFSCLF